MEPEIKSLYASLHNHFMNQGTPSAAIEGNVRRSIIYLCLAKYGDKPSHIHKVTGFEMDYVQQRIQWVKDNDQFKDKTISRDALLSYIRNGDAIIDKFLQNGSGNGATPKEGEREREGEGETMPAKNSTPAADGKPKSQIIRNIIRQQTGRFTHGLIMSPYIAQTGESQLKASASVSTELQQALKRGEIVLVEMRNGFQGGNVYVRADHPDAKIVAKESALVAAKAALAPTKMNGHSKKKLAVKPVAKAEATDNQHLTPVTQNALPPPATLAPVATTTTAELLPGPAVATDGNRFIELLQSLKARALGDAEALTRTLQILEREVTR